MILAGLILLGLVGWAFWTLRYQSKAIQAFTDGEARATPVLAAATLPQETSALEQKLAAFGEAVSDGEEARLELSARELNLAVAYFERFKELRSTFFVRDFTAEGEMLADIHFQLGASFFSDREENHLNAKAVFKPVLVDSEPVLRVESIEPSQGEVPNPFLEHMSPYRVMERYATDDEVLAPIFKKLTTVGVENGVLVVTVVPGEEADEDELLRTQSKKTLLLFMSISSVILALVALALVFGKKKSK